MKSFGYRVYGLTVASEIELPELRLEKSANPDVNICLGEVPKNLPGLTEEGVLYQAAEDDFLFRMEHIGAFRVQNGSQITVRPVPDCSPTLMRVFLLGSVFGALLHQKEILPLHGSAVATGNEALLITGRSSSGKSTLAAALSAKGYSFITDDISAVFPGEVRFSVAPGIPQMKLWKDVMKTLQLEEDDIKQIRPEVEKYRRVVLHGFTRQSLPVSKIIVLNSKNSPDIEISEIWGMEKFELLSSNTYRYQFVNGLQKSQSHFQSITDLAKKTRVFQVQRPSSPLLIDELSEQVIKHIINDPE